MTIFYSTQEAREFIDSAGIRETDESIMNAIAFHSDSLDEAVNTWENGLSNFSEEGLINFMETATKNYKNDAGDLQWGEATLEDVLAAAQ